MSLKDKLAAAMNRANKSKGNGDDPKVVAQKEVKTKASNVYTGPFAKMKAKKAIRKGETETAFAIKKRPFGKVVSEYADYSKGENKPELMKKTKTSKSGEIKKTKTSSSYGLYDATRRLKGLD